MTQFEDDATGRIAAPVGAPARNIATGGQTTRQEHVRTLWTLGLGGLAPFVVLTAILLYAGREFIAFPQLVLAFSGYSAVILSFLGGIRWGASLMTGARGKATLVLSVLPSIAAWLFLFVPVPWIFAAFAAAFLAQGAWDIFAIRRGQLPQAFGKLRLVLTAIVALCQTAAFVSTF